MKKILLFLLTILVLTSCSKDDSNVLYVYNWGEYIEPALIEKFEKETGIKVIYDTFEQNEDMYMKVKGHPKRADALFHVQISPFPPTGIITTL